MTTFMTKAFSTYVFYSSMSLCITHLTTAQDQNLELFPVLKPGSHSNSNIYPLLPHPEEDKLEHTELPLQVFDFSVFLFPYVPESKVPSDSSHLRRLTLDLPQ
jgi:hypothetical protein